MGNDVSKKASPPKAASGKDVAEKEQDGKLPAQKDESQDSDHEHDFEIIDKEEEELTEGQPTAKEEQNNGLWIGIDLGTSNCACAVWDSNRGSPKWMRLQHLTGKQPNGKVGRIVPSAVQIELQDLKAATKMPFTAADPLWHDICKWNHQSNNSTSSLQQKVAFTVGQKAVESLQQRMIQEVESGNAGTVIKSMKRVLGVCYTTKLKDLDPEFRKSLPFELKETKDGDWVVPITFQNEDDTVTIDLRPVHVAAILLQAIREAVPLYLKRAIPKKKMDVPGYNKSSEDGLEANNVVIGVPAYFGQTQRHAVEEAARLAGFAGHVSTLTESTAAAMAYGLFVGQPKDDKSAQKAILVLDMGGGTTDITIAHNKNGAKSNDAPDEKFRVILTDGDSRLGGEDMDRALFDLVMTKTATKKSKKMPELTVQQRQQLLQSCQQAKELLCGDVDHDEPGAESATVQLPASLPGERIEVAKSEFDEAIQPLLDQTAVLMERTLKRYAEKLSLKSSDNLIAEAILIGGATRVPALRQMLKDKFFADIELCTSVNAMSAVAQGAAIQAAILSQQVPLHELRSAMMLDTTPHAIGVMLPGGDGEHRFIEVLPRDSPLPAQGYATFYVADLDQKGVTVKAVENVESTETADADSYQPLGDFSFLMHRLTDTQREAILQGEDRPGLRPIDIGMSLGTDGSFQVSIFDANDPDHRRKREFLEKAKQDTSFEPGVLDYVQAAANIKSESMSAEEMKLMAVVALLFVFYIFVKVLLSKDNILAEEDMARIL